MTYYSVGIIYLAHLIYAGKTFYKIGRTIDIARRTAELSQIYQDLEIIETFEVENVFQIETSLHKFFCDKRYRGGYREELFELDQEDIILLRQLIQAVKIDVSKTVREIGVSAPDIIRNELKMLNDTTGLSWRQIAKMPEYSPVPPGTLCAFAKTGYLPNKWYHFFRLPELKLAPVCLKCGQVHVTKKCMANNGNGHHPRRVAIRIDNPKSAARTIKSHLSESIIRELVELLEEEESYDLPIL